VTAGSPLAALPGSPLAALPGWAGPGVASGAAARATVAALGRSGTTIHITM